MSEVNNTVTVKELRAFLLSKRADVAFKEKRLNKNSKMKAADKLGQRGRHSHELRCIYALEELIKGKDDSETLVGLNV